MNDDKYERTIDELETHACKWWPKNLREAEQRYSILPILLDSQEKFIALLKLASKNQPEKLFHLIEASDFPYTLFLKHLIVLTDFGSEPLQRVNRNFAEIFPGGHFVCHTGDCELEYAFSALPVTGVLNNAKMRVDTREHLLSRKDNVPLCRDLIMLLLYGGGAVEPQARSIFFRCIPYTFLGDDGKIEDYVRKNYIRVSKIMAGSTANALGNVAQQYVVEFLSKSLGENYNVKSNGTIPGVTQNDGVTLTSFDVVVDRKDDHSRHKKYVAVEITFQETTNSVIERKSGQARGRFEAITSSRNYIAYIIDGAGNFARRSATSVMCENSHCTVAYTEEEFHLLLDFIREKTGQ